MPSRAALEVAVPCREDPAGWDVDLPGAPADVLRAAVEAAVAGCRQCEVRAVCEQIAARDPGLFGVVAGRFRPWPTSHNPQGGRR